MTRRLVAAILAANCAVVAGVLFGINQWLHPGSMNGWISAAAFMTFVSGELIGYGVGLVHRSKETS